MVSQENRIKCRYCAWTTLRFRGKKRGETALRQHVLDWHEQEYARGQGLEALGLYNHEWDRDTAAIGEQVL